MRTQGRDWGDGAAEKVLALQEWTRVQIPQEMETEHPWARCLATLTKLSSSGFNGEILSQ